MMANKTANEVYAMAQDLLRLSGSGVDINGLKEDRVITWIDGLHSDFFEEFTKRGMNYPDYMKMHEGYTGVTASALSSDVSEGDVTFAIDTAAALPSSGAGVILSNDQYDIFEFTSNTSGTIAGITGVDFDHDNGSTVHRLYAMPSNFGRFRIEKERGQGVRVNGIGYTQVPDLPTGAQYAVYDNGTTKYLWLPRDTTGNILVTYDKKPTTIDEIDDTLDTPDYQYILYGLVGIMKQVLDDEYIPQKELQQQNAILQQALNRGMAGRRVTASSAYFRRYGI